MAIAAGVPMPAVYLIADPALNAFATGRDPQHASVAITTGLRQMLTRDELQGVLAHEMGHVRNYDIRLMLLMAVMLGTIVMLADVFWQILWSGSRGSSSSNSKSEGKGGGALMLVLVVVAVLLAIIAPILAQIIQLAVSRQARIPGRRHGGRADAHNPRGTGLSALRKISADPKELLTPPIAAPPHLYIDNPHQEIRGTGANSAFASHPPMQDLHRPHRKRRSSDPFSRPTHQAAGAFRLDNVEPGAALRGASRLNG